MATLNKIKVSNEEKNEIKKDSPDSLPLNPTAQGFSGAEIRRRLSKSITGEEGSVLSLLVDKMNIISDLFHIILDESDEDSIIEQLKKKLSLDGSLAMTGELDLGLNKIVQVLKGTNINDVANMENIEEINNKLIKKQDKLIAGENIFIDENTNVISASGGGSSYLELTQEDIDTKNTSSRVITGKLLKENLEFYVSISDNQNISGEKNFTTILKYKGNEVATKNDLSTVFRYKGSVNTYADLLLITGQEVGDVYNVLWKDEEHTIPDGMNYAWAGTFWDPLAGIVDLSNYYTKTEIDDIIQGVIDNLEDWTNDNFQNKNEDYIVKEEKSLIFEGSNENKTYKTENVDGVLETTKGAYGAVETIIKNDEENSRNYHDAVVKNVGGATNITEQLNNEQIYRSLNGTTLQVFKDRIEFSTGNKNTKCVGVTYPLLYTTIEIGDYICYFSALDKVFPFNKIKYNQLDSYGNVFTVFPPFYVKTIYDSDGNGVVGLSIAETKLDNDYLYNEASFFDGTKPWACAKYQGSSTATSGVPLESKTGRAVRFSLTRGAFRNLAYLNNTETIQGYSQMTVQGWTGVLQVLFQAFFGTTNSDSVFPQVSRSSALATGTMDNAPHHTCYNKVTGANLFLGIENLVNNGLHFLDGVNIQNRRWYLNNDISTFSDDNFNLPYTPFKTTASVSDDQIRVLQGDANTYFPLTTITNSNYNTYYCDGYQSYTGNRILSGGSFWLVSSNYGLFRCCANYSSSNTFVYNGSRLVRQLW